MDQTDIAPKSVFRLAIASAGSTTHDVGAAFQEASGLESAATPANLVLKRGYMFKGSPLAQWVTQTLEGSLGQPSEARTLILLLAGETGQDLATWTFLNAWPVKWELASISPTDTTGLATESLEIAFSSVTPP
ncbi:MAG TPA: phage tail protein [Magnetospirillaceae bacterium]|nr:phage tail protein [Magnetospirillaceae bacterium]